MKIQATKVETFYDRYGLREWERLERSPYDHLNFLLHMDFIEDLIQPSSKVCDVGCGAGRFSIAFAKTAESVTLVDISKTQLDLAVGHLEEHGLSSKIEGVFHTSLEHMPQVADDSYDVTVCYGAPLNYLHDTYEAGIKALYRITKPGGVVVVSVNSRFGVIRALCGNDRFDICNFLENHEYWYVDQVMDTGNLPEHPEVEHPARHFFTAKELYHLFEAAGFHDIQTGSSPCLVNGLRDRVDQIAEHPIAFQTLVRQEMKAYKRLEMADAGEFLLVKGFKPV